MKKFEINLCKFKVVVTIARKKFHAPEEKKPVVEYSDNHNYDYCKFTSTVNEPVNAPIGPRPGVYDCFKDYISSVSNTLSPATIKGYENVCDKHFDYIMIRYMDIITENDIQRAFDEEIEKGYSEKTIKGYRSLWKKVLAVYRPDLADMDIRVKKEIANEITKTSET